MVKKVRKYIGYLVIALLPLVIMLWLVAQSIADTGVVPAGACLATELNVE